MADSEFDIARVRRSFDRAADTYAAAAVLQHEVADRLLQGLDVVRLDARHVLDAGCGTGQSWQQLRQRYRGARVVAMDISENMLLHTRRQGSWLARPDCVCATLEALPFADAAFDLVFSSLAIQWCNSLPKVFEDVWRVLKPGGLFMFSSFGPDTLRELRACWAGIDDAVHVNRFIDMHDIGDDLLHAKFAGPVMHAEHLTLEYGELALLMQDLRDIGANVTGSGHRRGLLTASALRRLEAAYEQYRRGGVLPATYEVVYGHAWKPVPGGGAAPTEIEVRFEP